MQKVSSNMFVPPHLLKTAVLFLILKRPDTTKQVSEVIHKAKAPCVMPKQITAFMISLAKGKK